MAGRREGEKSGVRALLHKTRMAWARESGRYVYGSVARAHAN